MFHKNLIFVKGCDGNFYIFQDSIIYFIVIIYHYNDLYEILFGKRKKIDNIEIPV